MATGGGGHEGTRRACEGWEPLGLVHEHFVVASFRQTEKPTQQARRLVAVMRSCCPRHEAGLHAASIFNSYGKVAVQIFKARCLG